MMECASTESNNDHCSIKKSSQPKEILCALNTMRKSGDLTDTVIHVSGEIFHVHRAILACSSEYFRAMFTSNLCESVSGVVHFNDHIDPEIFSLLVDFSYTTEVTVTDTNAQALLEAACHLQYNKVIDACCDFLIENLDPSNCLGIQKFSESLSLWDLHKKAHAYALKNFTKVVKHDEYYQLTHLELQRYLSSDELNVDREESSYKAILAWIERNDSHQLLPPLLSCVRLPFARPDFLLDQLDNPLIKQNLECSNMLRSARNSQLRLRENYLSDSTLIPRYSTKSEIVVVVGGFSKDHKFVRDVFYYNPSSNRWGSLTRLPNLDIYDFAVGTLNNCIYISGGVKSQKFSNDVYCYNVDEEKWHSCQNFTIPRTQHSSIGVNGYLYIIGGNRGNKVVDTVERFCPADNRWEVVKPLPIAVSSPTVVSHKLKIYVVGGILNQSNLYPYMQCYETINNTWKIIETVNIPRRSIPVVIVDDIIYFMSGCGKNGMQVYDIKCDALLPPMSMSNHERNLFAATVVKEKIYVVGGNNVTSSLKSFDPQTREWLKISTMPSAVRANGHCLSIHKYLGPPFSSK
ncbi:kelch-like protein 24 [Anneissia japonica]|uniref:kelch-like protein 24 n=1 Tax=Anneissia japonica TaxID=1529436 RepID=UPI001425B5B7|nr:kelch-like protein 24 [Anneissia japonica]XP_033104248.1 kelch-like protein 24 [Anneissia japonica]